LEIKARPIGYVRNDHDNRPQDGWKRARSTIEVDEAYVEGLRGIGDYSHIMVLFWLDRLTPEDRERLVIHPKHRTDLPLVGVFATHSQYRPNPIAVTVCRLVEVSGRTLVVEGLDALDGTPVLDIKGYMPSHDEVGGVRVPEWVNKLFGDEAADG